ncbi:MAG: monovalent cation/H(+) antiporter subunit G [Comamonas sp.]|jgi:multicomponent K+:H+ antiporter subunit G
MTEINLPVWAQILVSVLVLAGALIALVGALGLFRLPNYYARVHSPSIIATTGGWCIVWGSIVYVTLQSKSFSAHALLIAIFIAITVPITNIFLMRAALFRDRRMGKDVPPSVSRIVATDADTNPSDA